MKGLFIPMILTFIGMYVIAVVSKHITGGGERGELGGPRHVETRGWGVIGRGATEAGVRGRCGATGVLEVGCQRGSSGGGSGGSGGGHR